MSKVNRKILKIIFLAPIRPRIMNFKVSDKNKISYLLQNNPFARKITCNVSEL